MFNAFQRFSAIFNDFQRFLGARPYRGVSRQNLRKVRKKSDTTPTEKPTGAPPKVGFQASSCPSDFRRTFLSSISAGEGPILAEKVSAKSRTGIGAFFAPESQFSPDNSANSGRRKNGTRTENPKRNPSIFRVARFAPVCPRFGGDAAIRSDPTFTRTSPRLRSYAERKLPQTTTSTY